VHAPDVKNICKIVYNDEIPASGEVTYVIPRSDDGNVLLGGTYQADSWDTSLDASTAHDIIKRCSALFPVLADSSRTRIVAHGTGLRPVRHGGPRVDAEWIELPVRRSTFPCVFSPDEVEERTRRVKVVHAYGFGFVPIL
jgi:D-amino-acid oxidase